MVYFYCRPFKDFADIICQPFKDFADIIYCRPFKDFADIIGKAWLKRVPTVGEKLHIINKKDGWYVVEEVRSVLMLANSKEAYLGDCFYHVILSPLSHQ